MPDLKIDLDAVRAIGSDLQSLAGEFEGANVRSDGLADAVGHAGLADAVRSFAHSWDDTREKMVEGIKGLGEATTVIADVFMQTDADLEAAFDAPAPSSPVNRGAR
ncbi:MAG TPA: hypothetical protein VFY91_03365 [Microbacterium sp.]|nr:hypothetical protein [Microbacterium sp.]